MIYTFRCRNCKHEEDFDRPIERRDDKCDCPVCDTPMVRIYRPINVVFAGSGFYSTDKHLTPVDPLDYDNSVHTPRDLET